MSAMFWTSRISLGPVPDLEERVVAGGGSVAAGGIELQAEAPELALPPARGERPVLALDVVHEDASRGHVRSVGSTQPTPLPERDGREPEHVLRAVVAEVRRTGGAPRVAPGGEKEPAAPGEIGTRISSSFAHRAEPWLSVC